MQRKEIVILSLSVGVTLWFAVLSPRDIFMKLIIGLAAIACLIYSFSIVIFSRIKGMNIPFWLVIILGGVIGAIFAVIAWQQTVNNISLERATNAELRDMVIRFTKNLRDFEHHFKSREIERDLLLSPPTGTREQQAQITKERNVMNLVRYAKYENDYRKKFLVKAMQYRNELYLRLKIKPTKDEFSNIIAFTGTLAGPSPINELATYLESLARLLSN